MTKRTYRARNEDRDERHICTQEEALAIIRRERAQGGALRARISWELPIEGEQGRCFPGSGYVEVDRPQAEMLIRTVLGDVLEGRGGRVRIHLYHQMVFIG